MDTSLELAKQRAALAGVVNAFYSLVVVSGYWQATLRGWPKGEVPSKSRMAAWTEKVQRVEGAMIHSWSITFNDKSLGHIHFWFKDARGLVDVYWDICDEKAYFTIDQSAKPIPTDLFDRAYCALVQELRNYLRRKGARVHGIAGKLLTVPQQ
jgi:hypothetical protein